MAKHLLLLDMNAIVARGEDGIATGRKSVLHHGSDGGYS